MAGPTNTTVEARTTRKVFWRLVPILILGYFISYIDRANISFAKAGLTESFGMSASAFGFAAGIFFAGYLLCEVPSNMLLYRFGARRWLSRIMISWGLVSLCVIFVTGPTGVYVLRFLLGAAEAGFFPGVILYLSRWFPNAVRARMTFTFMIAIPIASAFDSLVNGWILDTFDQVWDLEGWRWLFIFGGIPAVILGVVYLVVLSDGPEKARWLAVDERAWLTDTLTAEREVREQHAPQGAWAALKDRHVLVLTGILFLIQFGTYPMIYWLPTFVAEMGEGLSATQVGLVTAVPYGMCAVTLLVMARLVGRRDDQVGHIAGPLFVSVAMLVVTAFTLDQPLIAFLSITVAVMFGLAATPMFWSLPTSYLSGAAAASGIALINSLGNIPGFLSPYAVGLLIDSADGNDAIPMLVLVTGNVLAAILLVVMRLRTRRPVEVAGRTAD